ncbi:hypothetical protein SERLA73DRAFT_178494 [Serpula lacrymans var. lacrymans S7.3]|uniref:Tyrosine specific protein phosphatases domain-containing protein n=2 Tax=Serpula lacrymans var. lacrymans TaxID=341189 RepID=F8PRR4_SERL3|nr:uncharacterized protein SERLADRAFT_462969 [Serpula lacrymans var. lacrymans S7.9]EGO00634.1 hypothetical protein SERLA73DRAFT_178494 [Serpula lacrymans var. lacrymans S7.3]EGO26189.1 hypothetical protein SERLADRAFT_462969 [Serpula lacrymans var. lacrymans S7.9]
MAAHSKESLQKILSSPPFVVVDGVINIRDIGGCATSTTPGHVVKSGLIFRSGEPSRITEEGKNQLRALGIHKIYDMRSDHEIKNYKAASLDIEGIECIRVPIVPKELNDPVLLVQGLQSYATDELKTFLSSYDEGLEKGCSAFEQIVIHLRDEPAKACLFHCTAGKDRTGVLAALILMILGVSDEDISTDYSLTTTGLEPALPMLAARFENLPIFRDNWQGTLNMGSSRYETMMAFVDLVRKKYGSAEGYFKRYTTLVDEDFETLRRNLIVPKAD